MKSWKKLKPEQKKHVLMDVAIIVGTILFLLLVAYIGHIVEGVING